jgi:hypothetical protein
MPKERKFINIQAHSPSGVKSQHVLTTIRLIEDNYGHDEITLWNRGACAGTLKVRGGDGFEIVEILMDSGHQWEEDFSEPNPQ